MTNALVYDAAYRGDVAIQGPEEVSFDDVGIRGNWPRMIKLEKDVEENLRLWIDSEIEAFNLERADILEDWITWQKLYWAEPLKKVKNFPFKKAANVVIPLAAIAVEAFQARIMNTLFSVEPFWSIRPRAKEWIMAAKPFEKYLQSEVENGETLRTYEFCNETTTELVKLGTCVGKTGYEKLTKKSKRHVGGEDQDFYVTVKNGPTMGRVPLANFFMRFSELDPDTAPLVGEKHRFSWGQLKRFAGDGRMRKEEIEKIKEFWVDRINPSAEPNDGDVLAREIDKLANTEPMWTQEFEVYEFWCSFDVDEDGINEEIVIDYHKESRRFLSIRYNWYDDLHRPYDICNFINVEGIWPGIGLCKTTQQFQEEVTTIHRQRLDNATLANMAQIVLKKGMGYGPGEPVFPGKMWFVDDPTKDIREFKLSEIYPSAFNNEESLVRWFEKRTGVNEVVLGIPQEGTPGTATSDLTRLAEGNKKFDLVMKNIKRWLGAIGVNVVTNYQLFGNQNVHWLVLGEDGVWVDAILNMPGILIRRGAVIELTVTDSITNRDVEQQQWMSLFQLITNYYRSVAELAQLLGPEVFGTVVQKALISSDEALRRLLDTFGITDSDRFSLVSEPPNANGDNPQGAPAGPGAIGPTGGGGATAPNRLSGDAGVGNI